MGRFSSEELGKCPKFIPGQWQRSCSSVAGHPDKPLATVLCCLLPLVGPWAQPTTAHVSWVPGPDKSLPSAEGSRSTWSRAPQHIRCWERMCDSGGQWVPAVLLDHMDLLLLPLAVGSWLQGKCVPAQPVGLLRRWEGCCREGCAWQECSVPARPSQKRAPSEPGLPYKLPSSAAGQGPPLPSSLLTVLCLEEGRLTDFSEEAATCQALVARLTRPCPRGWVGPSVQMTLCHLSCSVLGCTHWGLEATHTYCPTVLEAGAWNQGIRAVSCWRLSGRNPLPPPGFLGLWPVHSLLVRTPVIMGLEVILIHCDHRLPLRGCSHSLSLR